MKKLLLSLAMVMGLGFAVSASTVEASQMTVPGTTTAGDYTIVIEKAAGGNDPVYHANTTAVRAYAKNTITVSGPSVKKVIFTLASDAGYRYTTLTASTGTVAAQAVGDTQVVWEGDATSVTFTVGDKATLGSDGESKSGQLRFTAITINEEGETPVDPNPDPNPGEDPVTPGENGEVTIEAPFAGFTTLPGANNVGGYTFDFQTNGGSTKPQVYQSKSVRMYAKNTLTVSAKKVTKIVFTLTEDAAYRYTTFTPDAGALTKEQAVGDTEIVWEGDAAEVTFTVGDKATLGSDGDSKAGQIRFSKVVVYGEPGEGGDTPVEPGTPDFYNGLSANADGWTVECAALPEGLSYVWEWKNNYSYYSASAYVQGTKYAVEATAVSPVIDLTEAMTANLSFEQVGNFFDTNMPTDCSVLVREENGAWTDLTISEWPAGNAWKPWVTSTADLTSYKGKKIQLGFKYTSTAERAGTWEIKNLKVAGEKTSSIADITVDADAPVEFYNLQGIRVENPSNGIFIRRQGNTVTKVLVK